MSKIGRQPIILPKDVNIEIKDKTVKVTGSKGELTFAIPKGINVNQKDGVVIVSRKDTDSKDSNAMWGTARANLNNAILGVSAGFSKKMIIEGIGYKAEIKDNDLYLYLGFSHPVILPKDKNIEYKIERNTITVSGISKELVGQTAAIIRAHKKPEPYKGKGIHYEDEIVRRKAGKKANG